MTRRYKGIFTWLRSSWGHFFHAPGRRTREMARRGGTAWEYSPWSKAGRWATGSRGRGRKRYRVRRRRP